MRKNVLTKINIVKDNLTPINVFLIFFLFNIRVSTTTHILYYDVMLCEDNWTCLLLKMLIVLKKLKTLTTISTIFNWPTLICLKLQNDSYRFKFVSVII